MGLGLLVDYALRQSREGKTCAEFYEWQKENSLRFIHWFTVDDLKFLARGGRIRASSAMLGSLLKIKPVMNVDDEGHLIAREKVKGRKGAIASLAGHLVDGRAGDDQTVFISHGDCLEDAQTLQRMIEEKTGIRSFMIGQIGPSSARIPAPAPSPLLFGKDRQP